LRARGPRCPARRAADKLWALAVFIDGESPEFFPSRRGARKHLAITPDFIETFKVVCPACKGRVVLKEDASGIKCTECRRVYPVRNDIPALIVEEATVEDEEPRETS
jgi:uncharacterized protein YbaR (Trm112 family)